MGIAASRMMHPLPAEYGSFDPLKESPVCQNLRSATATVLPMSKHLPVLLRYLLSAHVQYRSIWSTGSKPPHSTRLAARRSAIDVSSVHWPARSWQGPPRIISASGSKRPRGQNSTVVPAASPAANPRRQPRNRSCRSIVNLRNGRGSGAPTTSSIPPTGVPLLAVQLRSSKARYVDCWPFCGCTAQACLWPMSYQTMACVLALLEAVCAWQQKRVRCQRDKDGLIPASGAKGLASSSGRCAAAPDPRQRGQGSAVPRHGCGTPTQHRSKGAAARCCTRVRRSLAARSC